jgi:hypothetical protein
MDDERAGDAGLETLTIILMVPDGNDDAYEEVSQTLGPGQVVAGATSFGDVAMDDVAKALYRDETLAIGQRDIATAYILLVRFLNRNLELLVVSFEMNSYIPA